MTVTAPGFLTREQGAVNPIWLWPQSESYVKAVVYTVGSTPPQDVNMLRWAPGSTIRLGLGPTLAGDSGAAERLEDCAAELRRWTRGPVEIGQPANVTLDLGPMPSGILAQTQWSLSGYTIIGAKVTFLNRDTVTAGQRGNTMLHELGHVIGLAGHSPIITDVMSALPNRSRALAFGGDEAMSLTMIYEWRKAGNQFPDREPIGLASKTRWTLSVEN